MEFLKNSNHLSKLKTGLVFITLLILASAYPLFCQTNNKAYWIHNEYVLDSTGKSSIIIPGLKYKRISNSSSWGFIDSIGNILIPLEKYVFLNPIDDKGMILAKKGEKKGYIDIDENIIIPFVYDDLGVFSEELAPAVKNKKQGFINRKGETVIPFEYDYVSYVRYFYKPGIAVLIKNGKYGVIDTKNKVIIPLSYDKIDFPRNSDVIIAWKQQNWSCFSTAGKQLSNFSNYEIVGKTPMGYLPKDRNNLPILVTTKDNMRRLSNLTNTAEYHNATKRCQGSMVAQGGANYAYLDKNHNMVVPFGVYDYADVFGLGRKAIVAYNGKYGIIDEYGELVLPLEYDFIEQPSIFSSYANIFVAAKPDSIMIFDENLNLVPRRGIVSYMSDSGLLLITNKENKAGVLNYNGEQTIPFLYDTLYRGWSGQNGYIAKKDGLYGHISNNNEIIQPFEYIHIYPESGNLVYINQNGKAGIFDKGGNLMIPFEYDAIYSTASNYSFRESFFHDTESIYIVEKDGKFGTIDDKNNIIIPIIYDGLSGWVEYGPVDHFVKNNGKYGLISPKGEIVIPIEYDYIGIPQAGVIAIRKNGKHGIISYRKGEENREILPCIYDYVILDVPRFWLKDEKPESKIIVLQENIWKYYDLNGKLLQPNVPLKEITDKYGDISKWGEASNEHPDLDIKQQRMLLK